MATDKVQCETALVMLAWLIPMVCCALFLAKQKNKIKKKARGELKVYNMFINLD